MRCALAVLVLAGCAGVTHQIVPAGGDSFMIASHGTMGWSSGSAQKAKALEEAAAYCRTIGKPLEVVTSSQTEGGFGRIASAEVQFRCQ